MLYLTSIIPLIVFDFARCSSNVTCLRILSFVLLIDKDKALVLLNNTKNTFCNKMNSLIINSNYELEFSVPNVSTLHEKCPL